MWSLQYNLRFSLNPLPASDERRCVKNLRKSDSLLLCARFLNVKIFGNFWFTIFFEKVTISKNIILNCYNILIKRKKNELEAYSEMSRDHFAWVRVNVFEYNSVCLLSIFLKDRMIIFLTSKAINRIEDNSKTSKGTWVHLI